MITNDWKSDWSICGNPDESSTGQKIKQKHLVIEYCIFCHCQNEISLYVPHYPSECSKLWAPDLWAHDLLVHFLSTCVKCGTLFSPCVCGKHWSQALCWGDEVWIVESVRSAADASTIRPFKVSSVAKGSGMIKQLLTANRPVPFYPGQGSHLRAEHNRALFNCESSLWLSSAFCILPCQQTQRECALSTNPYSVEICCCRKRMKEVSRDN